MPKIPKPKILTLDPNDENIILGIPDDVDPSKIVRGNILLYLFGFKKLTTTMAVNRYPTLTTKHILMEVAHLFSVVSPKFMASKF